MNRAYARALGKLKTANLRLLGGTPFAPHLRPDATGQAASDLIRDRLLRPQPCMICRFGRSEMTALSRYLNMLEPGSLARKSLRYVRNEIGPFWWDDDIRVELRNQSGFFPGTDDSLNRFGALMLEDMALIDVLGAWLPEELRVASRFPDAQVVPLPDLEPYLHERPWSAALEGRKVLVIHPFEQTIVAQFARRAELFPGRGVLPPFELRTLRAVQSVVGTEVEHESWFDALDWMCDQVERIDFDTAIIGAGAYGLPLAAHVKRIGRQAVHLGGATQLLFGIRGKRWDDRAEFQHLFNASWVHPSPAEVPERYQVLEQGAYW